MKRVVTGLVVSVVFATACTKDSPPPSEPTAPVAVKEEVAEAPEDKVVDEILDVAPSAPSITPEQMKRYVTYRQKVLERLQTLVAARQAADAGTSKQLDVRTAAAVRAQQATASFAEQMRAAEEAVRKELELSREDVVNAGRVASDVLAQRQIWKMSGGDAALERARAELKKLEGKARAEAEKRLAANEAEFAIVREAKRARERFGDAAVDAALEHEEALWTVQKQTSQLTAEIY